MTENEMLPFPDGYNDLPLGALIIIDEITPLDAETFTHEWEAFRAGAPDWRLTILDPKKNRSELVWSGPITIDLNRQTTLVNGLWIADRQLKVLDIATHQRAAKAYYERFRLWLPAEVTGSELLHPTRSVVRWYTRFAGRNLAERIMRKAHQRSSNG